MVRTGLEAWLYRKRRYEDFWGEGPQAPIARYARLFYLYVWLESQAGFAAAYLLRYTSFATFSESDVQPNSAIRTVGPHAAAPLWGLALFRLYGELVDMMI